MFVDLVEPIPTLQNPGSGVDSARFTLRGHQDSRFPLETVEDGLQRVMNGDFGRRATLKVRFDQFCTVNLAKRPGAGSMKGSMKEA